MHSLGLHLAKFVREAVRGEASRSPAELASGPSVLGHDPEDTRTPPAPGAIQIGPLDVP